LHLLCSSSQLTGFFTVRTTEASLGRRWTQTFTDLDYVDDVTLLAEMLEVLLLALDVLKDEARPLGLEVN